MKGIVTPEQAHAEGSPQHATNHPWKIFFLDHDNQVVKEACSEGFTRARKVAPRLVDSHSIVKIAITGPVIPHKFRNEFKQCRIGQDIHTCLVLRAA